MKPEEYREAWEIAEQGWSDALDQIQALRIMNAELVIENSKLRAVAEAADMECKYRKGYVPSRELYKALKAWEEGK